MAETPIFDKENVLVSGGAGFIGSHLCDELVNKYKVICLDNFITGQERNIDHLLKNENLRTVQKFSTQAVAEMYIKKILT